MNTRELTLNDGTVVTGRADVLHPKEFSSVMVNEARAGGGVHSRVRLQYRGRVLPVSELTPAGVEALGMKLQPWSDGKQWASVGFGEENRDGALEFRFSKDKLEFFHARCRVQTACDYELSWPGRQTFRLPVAAELAPSVFDAIKSSRSLSRH